MERGLRAMGLVYEVTKEDGKAMAGGLFMLFGLILLALGAVAALIILRTLLSGSARQAAPIDESRAAPSQEAPPPSTPASRSGIPGTGPQDMSTFKAALETLETQALQDMLDMGAAMRPGTEDAIRQELQRRSAQE